MVSETVCIGLLRLHEVYIDFNGKFAMIALERYVDIQRSPMNIEPLESGNFFLELLW